MEACRRIRSPGCPGSVVVLNFVGLVVGRAGLRDGTAGELMRAVNVISNVDDSSGVEEGASADSWGRNAKEREGGVGVQFGAESSLVRDLWSGVDSDGALSQDSVEGRLEADGLIHKEVILGEGDWKPCFEHEGERELKPRSLLVVVIID